MLLFASCDSIVDKTSEETDFVKDLIELSNRDFHFFKSSTRSSVTEDLNEMILDELVLNEMIDAALDLSSKHDLEQVILASGYYSNLDQFRENLSVDRALEIMATNSTPEFYSMMMTLMDGEILDDDLIINNTNLLPNEQVAIIMVNNLAKNNMQNNLFTATRGAPDLSFDCIGGYQKTMKVCDRWLYAGLGLTVAFAFIPGFQFFSPLFAAATAIDNSNCSTGAMVAYMECVEAKTVDDEEEIEKSNDVELSKIR